MSCDQEQALQTLHWVPHEYYLCYTATFNSQLNAHLKLHPMHLQRGTR